MRKPRTFYCDYSVSDVSALCITSKTSSCLSWPIWRDFTNFQLLPLTNSTFSIDSKKPFHAFESWNQNRSNIKNIVSVSLLSKSIRKLSTSYVFFYNEIQKEHIALKSSLHNVMRYGVLTRQLESGILKLILWLTGCYVVWNWLRQWSR